MERKTTRKLENLQSTGSMCCHVISVIVKFKREYLRQLLIFFLSVLAANDMYFVSDLFHCTYFGCI